MDFLFLLLIDAGILTIFYLVFKKNIARALNSRERVKELETEINKLLAQFNNAADRNITILEERVLKLEDLIRRADQRIKLLQQTPVPKPEVSVNEPFQLRDRPAAAYAYPTKTQDQLQAAPIVVKSRSEEGRDEKVVRLHREGMGIDSIAHHLGISTTEVKLILRMAEDAL